MKTGLFSVSGILLGVALAGCQIPPTVDASARLASRYPQRDLTVAWTERQYWYRPVEATLAPTPVETPLAVPPAAPPHAACAQTGAC